jgi:hypothetical protein
VYTGNDATYHKNNYRISFENKVAITLSYFGSRDSLVNVADKYGVSRSTAYRAVSSIATVLYLDRQRHIFFPRTQSEWEEVMQGFEAIARFPGVCGAVDGTLIKRTRPKDHWGWYCRKGYTAYNVQGVVDSNQVFMNISARPGSCNDKSVWEGSSIGTNIHNILPRSCHFLADSGYSPREYMITPFPHDEATHGIVSNFNYLHSKTRIVVECTFGSLKGRFPILKSELQSKDFGMDGIIITACVVLHNYCIRHEDRSIELIHEADPISFAADSIEVRDIEEEVDADDEGTNDNMNNDPEYIKGLEKRFRILQELCM